MEWPADPSGRPCTQALDQAGGRPVDSVTATSRDRQAASLYSARTTLVSSQLFVVTPVACIHATVVVAAPSVKQACMRFPQDFNVRAKNIQLWHAPCSNLKKMLLVCAVCVSSRFGCMHASNLTPQKNWSQNDKSKPSIWVGKLHAMWHEKLLKNQIVTGSKRTDDRTMFFWLPRSGYS